MRLLVTWLAGVTTSTAHTYACGSLGIPYLRLSGPSTLAAINYELLLKAKSIAYLDARVENCEKVVFFVAFKSKYCLLWDLYHNKPRGR